MEKILSIAIPAYNVEKYLDRCLSSFEADEVLSKLEVLIINDGSTDSTEKIARRYCEKYPESYFLINKENGGHGSGINYGIKYATGKYFKVVDGDDWLKTEELTDFVNVLENQDTDVVAADYLCIQDGTDLILQEKFCTAKKAQYGNVSSMSKGEISDVIKMHALTIKTEILKNNNIVIDEHCFYVDAEYITFPAPFIETVYYHNKFIYMYRLGRDGQSMDIRSMQKRRDQHMHVINSLLKCYEKCCEGRAVAGNAESVPEFQKYMEKCIARIVENQFQIYISMGLEKGIKKEMKAWDMELKNKYPRVYSATNKKSITMLRKTGYSILPIGAIVYKIVK